MPHQVGWELEPPMGDLLEEANVLAGYPNFWRGPVVFAELVRLPQPRPRL